MDPREFCRERGFPRALLLTYAFDPLFFERIVLRDLWHGGTGEMLVVADERPVAEELPRWRGEVRELGRRYHLASVAGAGAFHPKLILRVSKGGTRVDRVGQRDFRRTGREPRARRGVAGWERRGGRGCLDRPPARRTAPARGTGSGGRARRPPPRDAVDPTGG